MNSVFKLPDDFIEEYSKKKAPFGFNGLGELVYLRTYSRLKPDGTNEKWFETIRRVVEGTYAIQKDQIESLCLGWNEEQAQRSAKEMYSRMFEMKFLPPGRGLWAMGTDIVTKKGLTAALNNCAFVSTKDMGITEPFSKPFSFLQDMCMLGVGVGFDTLGAGNFMVTKPREETTKFLIEDTREGWVKSTCAIIDSFNGGINPAFDYSGIREAGIALKTFGGVSSGSGPLVSLHISILGILDTNVNQPVTVRTIVDIMNLIGKCVVSGNVRRTAEIAFGDPNSTQFMDLKDYSKNPQRMAYGWTSNNSVFAELGMDYSEVAKRICINGEPGLAWLENMRKYSRMVDPPDNKDYRVMGGNPCLEQSLESSELCCVTGETRIQTIDGCPKIRDLVGKQVKVWNGDSWSEVTPFLAAKNKEIYRVTINDGSVLDCTDNHKWSIRKPGKSKKCFEVETKDLVVNSRIELFNINSLCEGIHYQYAFELGIFAGDGYVYKDTPMVSLCGPKRQLNEYISGSKYKEQHPPGYKEPLNRVSFKGILDIDVCRELNNKKTGFPDFLFTLDKESILKFVAGYIETDGSLRQNKNSHHYVLHGSEYKLRDFQILLRRVDINHATIRLCSPKGTQTNKGIRNQDLYSICIPSHECKEIPTIIKKATIFSNGSCINNAYPEGENISCKSVQKIKSIVKLEITQDTYCFTEPKNHKGVFGNVLTHQCLVESFPAKAESLDDYLRTLKFAYLYAKTVTLGMTHWSETNRIQLRNRRIGCSVSGVAQFLSKYDIHTLNKWLDAGYGEIQKWDIVYSEWFCIPRSIKMTSVKPSGTVSLLAGATPGMHYPESRFYIRRMRLASNSPLIDPLRKAGYKLEPAVGSEQDTMVVEIPIDVGEGIRTVNEVSMWEQVALAANLQRWWADNQVSCTVTFNPKTEGQHIASVLDYFQYQLKGISFLPKCDFGAFPQMPYEEITEELFNSINSAITPINFDSSTGEDSSGELYCDGDSCIKK